MIFELACKPSNTTYRLFYHIIRYILNTSENLSPIKRSDLCHINGDRCATKKGK